MTTAIVPSRNEDFYVRSRRTKGFNRRNTEVFRGLKPNAQRRDWAKRQFRNSPWLELHNFEQRLKMNFNLLPCLFETVQKRFCEVRHDEIAHFRIVFNMLHQLASFDDC